MDRSNGRIPERNERRFKNPRGKWFVWRLPIGETTTKCLLTEEKPSEELIINELDIVAYIMHIKNLCTLIEPLYHITTKVEITAV